MVFSSLPFLFLFLVFVLAGNYLLPKRARNLFLLLANLVFYAYGEPVYVLLMLASMVVNYFAALLIQKAEKPASRRFVLSISIVLNLAALGWFKYAGLLLDTLRMIPAFSNLSVVSIALPIGISFYTFQAMSYVIDVYRGDCGASVSFIDFAAYISLFPQLIAGPIVRYSDVQMQMKQRNTTLDSFSWGVRMFVIGLAKKVLLANQFALLFKQVAADPAAAGTVSAWCGALAYTLQIYFDFGGYSDMARGLGAMLGFDFCVNFNYPYIAKSVTDFWRRWHISLSSWFRDYVYIPLGGSRKGTARTVCNLLIVWMLTGLWHGAGWNFLLWGIYYGVILILEKFVFRSVLQRLPDAIRWLYTMVFVVIGWVIFASADLHGAIEYLSVMFFPSAGNLEIPLLSWLILGMVGVLAATPMPVKLWKRLRVDERLPWVQALLCLAGLVFCTASLVSGSYNPFLYFRF